MALEDIIEKVKAQPQLWQLSHPLYNRRKVADKTWSKIAQELGMDDVALLRKQWRNLRDSYYNSLRTKKTTKSKSKATWVHFDKLRFLDGNRRTRPFIQNNLKEKPTAKVQRRKWRKIQDEQEKQSKESEMSEKSESDFEEKQPQKRTIKKRRIDSTDTVTNEYQQTSIKFEKVMHSSTAKVKTRDREKVQDKQSDESEMSEKSESDFEEKQPKKRVSGTNKDKQTSIKFKKVTHSFTAKVNTLKQSKVQDEQSEESEISESSESDSEEQPKKRTKRRRFDPTHTVTDTHNQASVKFGKIMHALNNMSKFIEKSSSSNWYGHLKDDPDYMFLVSLLPIMQDFSDVQRLQFRGKVTDWLLNALSENENSEECDDKEYEQSQIEIVDD